MIKSEYKIDYMNENFVGLFQQIFDINVEKFIKGSSFDIVEV